MKSRDALALSGRRALVTSSSRNLGSEIARALARAGATVAVQYHDSREAAEALCEELRQFGGSRHTCVPGDTSTVDTTTEMVERAVADLGGIDILVNNSGPFDATPFVELQPATWDDVWTRNVTAIHAATRAVAPAMQAQQWGRVVNVSAGSAYIRNHSIYGLAKDAVIALTESLSLELAPHVTVNAVAPGQIEESAADIHEIDPTFVTRAIEHTPGGRLATRAEVAEIVTAMCGVPFDCMTGVTIPVDGGWRLNRF